MAAPWNNARLFDGYQYGPTVRLLVPESEILTNWDLARVKAHMGLQPGA